MTDLRLAIGGPPDAQAHGLGPGPGRDPSLPLPALLVSWFYWEQFAKERPRYLFRDYSLDSGAYSAHNSGKTINLAAYTEAAAELMATDAQCAEVFALDVIGDWRASMANTEAMWEAGVPAIPVYHYGEPESLLMHLAATYPKISLGGAVGVMSAKKMKWAGQCFARVWPKRIHGLGFGGQAVMGLPFHSVDATTWELGPCAFGRWHSYGGTLSIRGGQQNLRTEVEWYLRLEAQANMRWRRQMAELAALDDALLTGPTVRLAAASNQNPRKMRALGPMEATP